MSPSPLAHPSARGTTPRVFLALGSNLGDRREYLNRAVSELDQHPGVQFVRQSSLYETEPVGGPAGQGPYLNAVIEVKTDLTPAQLLALVLEVEKSLGRDRGEPDSPRTIDIDILFYDDQVVAEPGLTIPHPRMETRRFVLQPLAEIAPRVLHPTLQRTAWQLLAALPQAEGSERSCRQIDWD